VFQDSLGGVADSKVRLGPSPALLAQLWMQAGIGREGPGSTIQILFADNGGSSA
jgi:hypothetical protein